MSSIIDLETPATCTLPHRATTLPNGLKVIAVQDKETKQSAAAMCVKVGSHADPIELPGLAHLCEHMLFLGTEKYPKEGEYHSFVENHGGASNAWTEDGCTMFYFDVTTDNFFDSVDRFMHFFICPLFTASCLEREISNVNAEDEKNHNSDYWRRQELWKFMMKPSHPSFRYGNGNLNSLWTTPKANGVDVRAKILEYYEKYFIANASCITVYSPFSLEEVLEKIEPVLGKMKTGTPFFDSYGGKMPLDEKYLGQWVNFQTVSARQRLRLSFPIPYSVMFYETMPSSYTSYILGHECKGSALEVLKELGLVESLCAGVTYRGMDNDWDEFLVEVGLTNEGIQKVDKVLDVIFQAIDLIRQAGVVDRIQDEAKVTGEIAFSVEDHDTPSNHASTLSRSAVIFDLQRAWSACHHSFKKPDNAVVVDVWKYLVPKNCIFMLQLKDFDAQPSIHSLCDVPLELTMPIHGAKYGMKAISEDYMKSWAAPKSIDAALSLPAANPFLASDFTVHQFEKGDDMRRVETNHGVVYWRRDNGRHAKPRTAFAIELLTMTAYTSPLHRLYIRVLLHLIADSVTELAYFAELGNIQGLLIPISLLGIEFTGEGPTEKIFEYFLTIVTRIFEFDGEPAVSPAKYQVYFDKVKRELLAGQTKQPYEIGYEFICSWLNNLRWTSVEVLAAAEEASYSTFLNFVKSLKGGLYYEAMWFGNIPSPTDYVSKNVSAGIEALLGKYKCAAVQKASLPRIRDTLQVPQRLYGNAEAYLFQQSVLNPNDKNNSIEVFIQIGLKSPKTRVMTDCLVSLLSGPFFAILRGSETLGYIVACVGRIMEDICCLNFIAQSPDYDILYLFSRIYAFILAIPEFLKTTLSDGKKFESVVKAQISAREDLSKNIRDEAAHYWARRDHPFGFHHKKQEIEALKKLTVSQLLEFSLALVSRDVNAATFRPLIIAAVYGNTLTDELSKQPDERVLNWQLPKKIVKEEKKENEEVDMQLSDFSTTEHTVVVERMRNRESFRSRCNLFTLE